MSTLQENQNMNRMFRTIDESWRAPGLPYPPQKQRGLSTGDSKFLAVSSINYDFLPMNLDSPKMLWVDLPNPAPEDLLVGTPAKLHITPGVGIQTNISVDNLKNSVFEVDDVIGSRVVLSPYKGSAWLPTNHAPCDSPFGWGYDTEWTNVSTSMHNNKYGYGTPVSFLEYQPVYYSHRATKLDAARIEEDWYRGTHKIPGWHS